ncbi:MAG: ASCH domain-containing protein [Planctomycetota bacterium]
MKALSVKQPFADWIASGRKTIEVRSWSTQHRGDLLIVSSKKPAAGTRAGDHLLGCAICVVELVACRPMVKGDEGRACCELFENVWTWELSNVRKIESFPVTGKLRLYDVDYEIE